MHTELTTQNLLLPSNQEVLTPQGRYIAQKHTRRLATREPQASYFTQDHAHNSATSESMTEQYSLSAPDPSDRGADDGTENSSCVTDSIPFIKEELTCFAANTQPKLGVDLERSLQAPLTQALTDTEEVTLQTQDTPEVDMYSPQPPAASPDVDKSNSNATDMYTDEPGNSSSISFCSDPTIIGPPEATAVQGSENELRLHPLNASSSTPLSQLILEENGQPVEEVSPKKQNDQSSEEPNPHVAPVSTPPNAQQTPVLKASSQQTSPET